MRTCVKRGIVVLVVVFFVVILGCTARVLAQPGPAAPLDARIQQLMDLHILLGAPDGDLQLDRQVNGGEFVVLLERALQLPATAPQHLGTADTSGESSGWVRAYAWTRSVWNRVLNVRTQIRHVWFGWRYRVAEGSGWGVEQSHWMFTSLRNAYLDDGLIDLSFEPMKRMGGNEGVAMFLTAAGFGGEVEAMEAQMNASSSNDALRFVCEQHGFSDVMEYAGKPLTRRDAALLVWRLLVERAGSD